nr:hypothetical protein [uncultured Flavobacterium sp.]
MKTSALALMETASFYGGVHHKRYSGQQEIAPEEYQKSISISNHKLNTNLRAIASFLAMT